MKLWMYFGKSLFHTDNYGDGYTKQNVIDELTKRTSWSPMFQHLLDEVTAGKNTDGSIS
jgi:hypothetical protein